MKCKKVQNILDLFLDGILNSYISNKIEKHLSSCGNCQKYKNELAKTWQLLECVPEEKVNIDFAQSLMKKIHLEQAVVRNVRYVRPQFSFRFAYALAPVLALLLLFVFVPRRQAPVKETPIPAKVVAPEIKTIPQIKAVPEQLNIPQVSYDVNEDEEIVKNLDLLQNLDILQNFDIVSDIDFLESVEDSDLGA